MGGKTALLCAIVVEKSVTISERSRKAIIAPAFAMPGEVGRRRGMPQRR